MVMSRFDSFCMYMIAICLAGAVIVGVLAYRDDIGKLQFAAKQSMPGCRSKYTCTVHYERGKPVVVMARNTK